jgi:hypothetical protein
MVMRTVEIMFVCALMCFAAACASANGVDEDPIIPQHEVDVPPRLLSCTGGGFHEPPSEPGIEPVFVAVTVPVLVGADGTVQNIGAPLPVRSPSAGTRLSGSARAQARDMAGSCLFEPATLHGLPVTARFELRFAVPS